MNSPISYRLFSLKKDVFAIFSEKETLREQILVLWNFFGAIFYRLLIHRKERKTSISWHYFTSFQASAEWTISRRKWKSMPLSHVHDAGP